MPAAQPRSRLYILDTDLSSHPSQRGRILSCSPDGSDVLSILTNLPHLPDGITVDPDNKHIYWTNMGASMSDFDGSIQRCSLSGTDITTIIPQEHLHTPKQITLVKNLCGSGKNYLYFCDREGMRVLRCALDGSELEVLVETGKGEIDKQEKRNWCVGIAVDAERGVMYWTQKGNSKGNEGQIFRCPASLPPSTFPSSRSDIEVLLDGLPEPIDLHLSAKDRILYWTDRGDPPRGNTVNCLDLKETGGKEKILVRKLYEVIGLAPDERGEKMYFSDLDGAIYEAGLDGSRKRTLLEDAGDCNGIAIAFIA